MKRSLVLTILGIAATATAFGQGGIAFVNSWADAGGLYHPLGCWFPGYPWYGPPSNGWPARPSSLSVTLTFWYGAGVVGEDQLVPGPVAEWNTGFEGLGYYGYYNPTVVVLPTWTPRQTFTFQLRATGTTPWGPVDETMARSSLWEESENIAYIGGTPPGLPGTSTMRIGFPVYISPEPSTTALLGLGMAALLALRRCS